LRALAALEGDRRSLPWQAHPPSRTFSRSGDWRRSTGLAARSLGGCDMINKRDAGLRTR